MAECRAPEKNVPPSASALPPPAFSASLRPVQEFTVGFTCTFLNAPKELTTQCPICLHILREPFQATCCGSIYCELCIQRVKDYLKPCPACRKETFDIFPDRGLRNSLYGFKVSCINVEKGCKWSGELRYMEGHLNISPEHDQRFFGCEYAEEKCPACGKLLPRRSLEEHELKGCPKRAYTCEYCGDYSSTFDEVVGTHWEVCPQRPTPCPNDCGVYPLKKDLDRHLRCECDLREPAPASLGTPSLDQDEIRKHIEATVKAQLTSMAAEFLKKAVQDEIAQELKDIAELRTAVEDLKKVKEESQNLRDELAQLRLDQSAELSVVKSDLSEDRESIQSLKLHISIVPITFTIDGYKSRYARKDRGWTSPCFYTHPRGYRMCLLVDVGGPTGPSEGVFMSVYLNLTRGDYDADLKWPFLGSVTISLLSQGTEKLHHVVVIKYQENTHVSTSGRVWGDRSVSKPWGKGKFIRHDQMEGFVENDEVKVQVTKVVLGV